MPATSVPGTRCPACRSEEIRSLAAPDNTAAASQLFGYSECQDCKTTFLDEAIDNLATTYPDGYYSLQTPRFGMRYRAANLVLRAMLAIGLPTRLVIRAIPSLSPYYFLNAYSLSRDAAIVDVGSGTGRFVHRLRSLGHRNVQGIDPYINGDILFKNGAFVAKRSLADLDVRADVFFFNHSLEHVSDPIACLRDAASKLAPGGRIVVRIPLAASFAHVVFGTSWWQFDAPRHVTLFSAKGFRSAIETLGLELEEVVFDGAGHSLATSMAIKAGGCTRGSEEVGALAVALRKLTPGFRKLARELNRRGLGDQAMFILRPRPGVA